MLKTTMHVGHYNSKRRRLVSRVCVKIYNLKYRILHGYGKKSRLNIYYLTGCPTCSKQLLSQDANLDFLHCLGEVKSVDYLLESLPVLISHFIVVCHAIICAMEAGDTRLIEVVARIGRVDDPWARGEKSNVVPPLVEHLPAYTGQGEKGSKIDHSLRVGCILLVRLF